MRLSFIPREEKFFELFVQQAQNVVEGAQALKDLLENYTDVQQKRMKIEAIEGKGDEMVHQVIEKLNLTFVTPMDREDIHALASALDDILDLINAASQRLDLYNVRSVTEDAKTLGNIILLASEETLVLTQELGNKSKAKQLKTHWVEVNRLENEGDQVSRRAIAALFNNEPDPIEIIKWKELYEHLETAIDKCEDAANIVEAVVLKNG